MAGAFTWGSGGAKLTPEDIALQRAVLARRRAGGVDTSPVGHWTQGLARVADALGDVFQEKRLDAAAGQNAAENQSLLSALLGGGSTSSASPVASALTGTNASVTPATIPQTADAAALRQGLIDRGLPAHIADGFLVNFQDESGLNPGINEASPLVPGSRGGYGLYQLTGPRRVAYEQFAQSRGVDPSDINAQLDFLGGELGLPNLGLENQPWFGSERNAANSILAAGDQASAAQAIVNNFLRPSQEHRERRAASYASLGQGGTVSAPQVASTQNVAPTNSLGVSPAVLQALTSPYASESTKTVANLLLQQQQGAAAEARKQALAEQQRQQEIQQRQGLAGQLGINPVYAQDSDLWKGAVDQQFADAPTATVNGIVVNTRTGQPVFTAPQQPTSDMQNYQSYADYETRNGRTPLGPLEYEQALRRSGATNIDTGTIPTGYQAVRDAEGRLTRYDPVPGGPADTTKKEGLAKTNTERSGNIVLEDVDRAVNAIESNPALTTGIIGNWSRGISGTPANKVQNLLQTIRANSAFDRLQQMREASPTGGALGAVSDSELGLLQNAIGSLEQSNDSEDLTYNLRRVQGIYEDIIYGKDEAKRLREERRKATSENPLPPQPNAKKTSTGVQWSID
jgi:hypothetical protein